MSEISDDHKDIMFDNLDEEEFRDIGYGVIQKPVKYISIVYQEVLKETQKAWLVVLDDGAKVWLPKSKCYMKCDTNEIMVPDWLHIKVLKSKSEDKNEDFIDHVLKNEDQRYPYTYAYDYIRSLGGFGEKGTKLSRHDALNISNGIFIALGMFEGDFVKKLADYYKLHEEEISKKSSEQFNKIG